MTPQPSLPPVCICRDRECSVPYGYCHCGCGKQTPLATSTWMAGNLEKGCPIRYIHGHHRTKQRINARDIGQFKIDGIYCRLIPLTQGMWTIVDADDFEWLMQWRWFAVRDEHLDGFYAARNAKDADGNNHPLKMHRFILDLGLGDEEQGDHKDTQNTLDNRRKNLRTADRFEQTRNRRLFKNNTTGFKGVNPCVNSSSFRARIMIDGKRVHLGVRSTAEAAYRELYVPAAKKYYGEFARF